MTNQTQAEPSQRAPAADALPGRLPALRLLLGGGLMGLANLVPGISGGTMLVAAGVYRRFVDAVSDATRLKLGGATIPTLALIGVAAMAAIALGSGPVAYGLAHARWAMYALFIGLTIGGVPALWALVRPLTGTTVAFALAGLVGMLAVVFLQESGVGAAGGGQSASGPAMLVVAGVAGAAAMVLPGVSGAYLLLLLGQYEAVVNAISALKGGDLSALRVVIPIGMGVAIGVAGVSNLLRWLLHKYEKPTLAVLLGLLIGAPAGLYPFREAVTPAPGGLAAPAEPEVAQSEEAAKEDAELRAFTPTPVQVAASLGLIAVGCAATMGVARLGRRKDGAEPAAEDGN
jgi:putative membrane protein